MKTIDGKIEAVGQFYLNGPSGKSYTFVRLVTQEGKVVSLKNVATDNEVGSYIEPGTSGRFCFYEHQQANVLCGYSTPTRTAIAEAASDPIVMLLRGGPDMKTTGLRIVLILSGLILTVPALIGMTYRLLGGPIENESNFEFLAACGVGLVGIRIFWAGATRKVVTQLQRPSHSEIEQAPSAWMRCGAKSSHSPGHLKSCGEIVCGG